MNKDIMNKWVEALRSGRYPQTQNYLCSSEGFCCLGVLCDLFIDEGRGDWSDNDEEGVNAIRTGFSVETYELPGEVMEWAGMGSSEGMVNSLGVSLMHLNDGQMKSFDEIADVIETHYKEI